MYIRLRVRGAIIAMKKIKVSLRFAKNVLRIAQEQNDTNAPINEKEGNLGQAKLERTTSASIKEALSHLKKINVRRKVKSAV